jgi:hypothetical protein
LRAGVRTLRHDTGGPVGAGPAPGTIGPMSSDDTATVPPADAVEVLVDRGGRLGVLSYLPPEDGTTLRPGDGVVVPFGASQRTGTIIGFSRDPRATRHVTARTVRRSGPREIDVARALADHHLDTFDRVAARLSPLRGLDDPPADPGPVALADGPTIAVAERDPARRRWLLLRTPLTDPHRLAAQEAARLHADTGRQILVLCPTTRAVTATVAQFTSGALRLDARAPAGAWAGFATGTVPVAIATRAAALYRPRRLGGLIVVEPEHPGHVESAQPYTHAREIAAARASASRCALSLISACPDAASLGAGVKVVGAGQPTAWPKLVLIDRGQLPPSDRLIPPRLRHEIARHIERGARPVVLAERQTTTLRCRQCRTLWPCAEADCTPATCRHQPERGCGACGTRTRIPVGFDKDRLSSLLPGARAVSLAELGAVSAAGLVVVFDISAATRAAEWTPGTLAARILTTAAQAAGDGGTLLVCSWDRPAGVVTTLLRNRDQLQVARGFWDQARRDRLPPFGRIVTIRTRRPNAPRVDGWPGTVYGPRRVASGEWELVVACQPGEVTELSRRVQRLRSNGKVRVTVQ